MAIWADQAGAIHSGLVRPFDQSDSCPIRQRSTPARTVTARPMRSRCVAPQTLNTGVVPAIEVSDGTGRISATIAWTFPSLASTATEWRL